MSGRTDVRQPDGAVLPRSWTGPLPAASVRSLEDLSEVTAVAGCRQSGPAYFMFRDIAQTPEDRAWMHESGLRFDITVIPPRVLCGEYIKTKGHYHPPDPAGSGYPEIYEVLSGEAHYLVQTVDCSDVILISARAGDVVVVPSGYGHVTINPSKRSVLEMANIVSSRFSSDYRGYEGRHGAAYFEMETGEIVKNPAYPEQTTLRMVKAGRIAETTGPLADPLYQLIRNRDPVLGYLNNPEKYGAFFRDLYP